MSLLPPLGLVWAGLLGAAAASAAGFGQSKHNLSVAGRGPLVATQPAAGDSTESCIFCHTPHTAKKRGLWNRYDSTATYLPYRSTTLKANVGQPTGASKLCLSCHDGTVALGMVRSRAALIPMRSGSLKISSGGANLGTDLTDDHPISFKYDAALVSASGQLRPPTAAGHVRLDDNNELQCTSCHEPHSNENPKFLVMNNTASALCVTCHDLKNWGQSSHRLSAKTWNGSAPNPWPHTAETSVAANACENCHNPHGAGGKQRLLNYAAEEQNCYPCHNGNVASKDLLSEFNKPSVHPVLNTTGVHDPMEPSLVSAGASRHVECADCHNPHASSAGAAGAPGRVSGALAEVRGVNLAGANVAQVTFEYELCFRCHGDTARGPALVSRQFPQLNTRQEFQNSGGTNSFHPVVSVGLNPNVPSLKSPWTSASMMACSDCHNSNAGSGAGGVGPNGPHGSVYRPILERMLSFADIGANPGNSALCFKCHNFVNTAWSRHVEHMGITSCMTCHDPHGSPNSHLINFNPNIVTGARSYQARGTSHGTCVLSCHGRDHVSTY